MGRNSTTPAQIPGADPVKDDKIVETTKLNDPVNVGAKNTVDSPASEGDVENVTVSMAEFRAMQDRLSALADLTTQLQAAQRQTAAAAVVEEQVARPTVKEALANKPDVPVLCQEGWLVPDSRDWIIARRKD